MRLRSLILVLALAAPCGDATAQTTRQTPARLTVTAVIGSASGTAAGDLEEAMSSAGYREAFGGCDFFICVPTRPGPESYSHANPSLFTVRYAVNERFGVEMLLAGSAAGTTSGRSTTEILDIEHAGTVLAPLLSVGSPALRVSGGPALLLSHWNYRSPDNGNAQRVRTTSVGLVGSASLRFPARTRFFAEATAQYRTFNPVTVRASQAGRPSGRVSVSHSFVGAGVGVALR